MDVFSRKKTLPLVIINENIRQKLVLKRKQLGLSVYSLAALLNVNHCTISNWEKGRTSSCIGSHGKKLLDFINGKYDNVLSISPHIHINEQSRQLLASFTTEILTVYSLQQHSSIKRQKIIAILKNVERT